MALFVDTNTTQGSINIETRKEVLMKKIILGLFITIFIAPSIAFAQSVSGKLFRLSNNTEFDLVREIMFYSDGTYLSITANHIENSLIVDKGYYLEGNGLLFYTNKTDTTVGNVRWMNEDVVSISLANGEQYIYEEIGPLGINSPYVIPQIPHKVKPMKVCPFCHGSTLCSHCEGTGVTGDYRDCTHCGTTSKCSRCYGTGKVPIK